MLRVHDKAEWGMSKVNALELLTMVEKWLQEPGAEFGLGKGANYSLADVFLTSMMTRIAMNGGWF